MKTFGSTILLFLTLSVFAQGNSYPTEKRIAFLVGIANYPGDLRLRNPVNDAVMMADSLYSIGFDTIKMFDVTKAEFEERFAEFARDLPRYSSAVFYFAGHGIQVENKNFLIPIDSKLRDESDVRFRGIPLSYVLDEFNRNQKLTSVVILDACRQNPYRVAIRGEQGGLAPIETRPRGSIIAYAAEANHVALDGKGKNGLYTEALVHQIMQPQSIYEVLMNTRREVLEKSQYQQYPDMTDKLLDVFYFLKPDNTTPVKRMKHNLYEDDYRLFYADTTYEATCMVSEFTIYDVTDSTFSIVGGDRSWAGVGVIKDDNTGKYDWIFTDGRKGTSYIRIYPHGSIKGSVKGKGDFVNWVYIAYPQN